MLRVLIVEDEPLIGLLLEDILQDSGHQTVGVAESMVKALSIAAEAGDIDVAIMDIDLSSQPDGVEAARQLRALHGIQSLFVSANINDKNLNRASSLEPIGFVAKSFIEEQITSALAPLDADPPRFKRSTAEQLVRAFDFGKLTGSDPSKGAGVCPWGPTDRRDLRNAWLSGFTQGRALLRMQLA